MGSFKFHLVTYFLLLSLLPLLAASWAFSEVAARRPVSAHQRDGVKELLDVVRGHLPEAAFVFPQESLTDASERDIAAELIRAERHRHPAPFADLQVA